MSSEEETKQMKDQEETEDKKKEQTDGEVFPKPAVPAMPAKVNNPKPSPLAQPQAQNKGDIEKEQELQLRSKYPGLKGPGSSAFLQKRLSKGQKYFDSGDYNMARAKGGAAKPILQGQKLLLTPGTADAPATGDEIPTPDTVPQRKASIVPPTHPSQQSQFTSIPAHLSS